MTFPSQFGLFSSARFSFSVKRNVLFTVLQAWLLFICSLEAQNTSFVRLLPPGTFLNDQESELRNRFVESNTVLSSALVTVSNIKDYLTADNQLSIELPDLAHPLTFKLDNATIKDENEYYWSGIGLNAATIRIFKSPIGNLVNIYCPENHSNYVIKDLSDTRQILIRHQIPADDIGDCGDGYDEGYSESDEEALDRENCTTNTVRVLYVYTIDAALASSSTAMATLAAAVTAEINTACTASGINTSELNFVNAGCEQVPYPDSECAWKMLKVMKQSNIIKDMQKAAYADIVVLFAKDLKRGWLACGAAGDAVNDAKTWDEAYCCSMIEQAETYFKATHGIGHIMGAGHQKCKDGCKTQCSGKPGQAGGAFDYNHGKELKAGENSYIAKTIMSDCHGYELSRVGRWSAVNMPISIPFPGGPISFQTGDEDRNNARRLKVRTGRVACFRPDPPPPANPSVSITGPNVINRCGGYTYTSALLPSTGAFGSPVTYQWEISTNGFSYTPLNLGSNFLDIYPAINDPLTFPASFYLRLKVTSPLLGVTTSNSLYVSNYNCNPAMGSDDRNESTLTEIINEKISVAPNPMEDRLYITGTGGEYSVKVFSLDGKLLLENHLQLLSGAATAIDTQHLNSGMYYIAVDGANQHFVTKIVKL